MELSDEQLERYARHVILDEVGEAGQEKLLASSVLVVGAGGLGAPLLLYLAAAGVGRIGIVDDDAVDLSNLQRQVIHDLASVGEAKVTSAARRIKAVDPALRIETHALRLNEDNAEALIGGYDLIADGSDNFATRYLLNEVCHRLGKTLVGGALLRFEGQVATFKSYLGKSHQAGDHPCYRCLFPEAPPPDLVPRCDQAGIFGAVAGVIGSLQATEVLKELLGLGTSLSGRLVIYDALDTAFRVIRFKRDPDCPVCGHAR